jgi:hypothetical protein
MLACFGRLLLVGVFQLAEVENLRDRGICIGGYLDEIEACLFGGQQCVID